MPDGQPEGARFCIRCGTRLTARRDGEQDRMTCPSCDWTYYPKPNVASAVAIVRDGNVLLARRKHEPFAGLLTLPSGFIEYGETPEECAVREIREEVGVDVRLTGLADVVLERADPRGLCLVVVYTGRITSGEPRAGDDASTIEEFPLDRLPEDFAWKAHRRALERMPR